MAFMVTTTPVQRAPSVTSSSGPFLPAPASRCWHSLLLLLLLSFAIHTDAALLKTPWTLASSHGRLDVLFVDTIANVTVVPGLPPMVVRAWNGSFVAPTLRLRPGDTLSLQLVNRIGVPTNIHWHGLQVSPLAPGDNIFVVASPLLPSNTVMYTFTIPATHPPGLYWYHSHAMGDSEWQVWNGMSGALVIEGLLDPFPQLSSITEQILCLRDVHVVDGAVPATGATDSSKPTHRLVNGQVMPSLHVPVGSVQLWRLANVGPDILYNLSFVLDSTVPPATVSAWIIAVDGNRQTQLTPFPSAYLLMPTARVELLVKISADAPIGAQINLTTMMMSTGPAGDIYPLAPLVSVALIDSLGGNTAPPLPSVSDFPVLMNLKTLPIARKRTFVFSENDYSGYFYINGYEFEMDEGNTPAVTATLGDVEEWELINTSFEMHVFHIHQGPFQVVSTSTGGRVPVAKIFTGYQDNVLLPAAQLVSGQDPIFAGSDYGSPDVNDTNPAIYSSRVSVIIPFLNPSQVGRFVFHCHIMAHEDLGMMASIQVIPPCPAGSYVDTDGSYQCLPCPPNSYSPAPATTASCIPCPCNTCSPGNATTCTLCSSASSSSGSAADLTDEQRHVLLVIKGVAIAVEWIAGASAFVPVWLKVRGVSTDIFTVSNALAGGIFLSISLAHMGNDATSFLYTVYDFPIGLVVLGGGFLTIFMVEQVIFPLLLNCVRARMTTKELQHANLGALDQDMDSIELQPVADQGSAHHEAAFSTSHQPSSQDLLSNKNTPQPNEPGSLSKETLYAFTVLSLICVHEIFEGLALGIQTSFETAVVTIVAVGIHKCIEAFAIGAAMAMSNLPRTTVVLLLLMYTSIAPIGVAIGIGVSESQAASLDFATSIIAGFSSGTFFYIATMMLREAYENKRYMIIKVALTLGGYAALSALAAWA